MGQGLNSYLVVRLIAPGTKASHFRHYRWVHLKDRLTVCGAALKTLLSLIHLHAEVYLAVAPIVSTIWIKRNRHGQIVHMRKRARCRFLWSLYCGNNRIESTRAARNCWRVYNRSDHFLLSRGCTGRP